MNEPVKSAGIDGSSSVAPGQAARLSVVIPMKDEAENAAGLLDGCVAALADLGPFEICVTDDGSGDGTGQVLRDYADAHPRLQMTIVSHPRSAGQSAAVHAGVLAAGAPIVCTLDGDGQNPPSEIPKLVAPLLAEDAPEALGLVAGQRVKRQDTLSKRLASRAANAIRSAMLGDRTRDTGCGLKAFRRDAFLALPFFDHMHRYLPALFARDGWEVAHVDVAHAPRVAGRSKYSNFQRAVVGATDLFGVAWLIRRRRRLPRGAATVTRSGERETGR